MHMMLPLMEFVDTEESSKQNKEVTVNKTVFQFGTSNESGDLFSYLMATGEKWDGVPQKEEFSVKKVKKEVKDEVKEETESEAVAAKVEGLALEEEGEVKKEESKDSKSMKKSMKKTNKEMKEEIEAEQEKAKKEAASSSSSSSSKAKKEAEAKAQEVSVAKFVNDTGFVVVDQIGSSFNTTRTNPAVYMSMYLQRAAFLAEDAAYMKLRFVHDEPLFMDLYMSDQVMVRFAMGPKLMEDVDEDEVEEEEEEIKRDVKSEASAEEEEIDDFDDDD